MTRHLSHGAIPLWLRLARVYQQIDARSAQAFRSAGLSAPQFDVLVQIGAHPGLTQQALAERLLVTKGNVSQLVARMEAQGWVRRDRAGRANGLFLTEVGQGVHDEAVPAQEARITQWFSSLSAREQRDLLRLLRSLDRSLRRDPWNSSASIT